MFFSGIADEASPAIEAQIKAHRELGWNHLELRLVDGENICCLSDAKFKVVYKALKAANMMVSDIASPIGDWSHSARDSFLADANLMRRAVKRAQQLAELGMMPFVRVMSYPNDKENQLFKQEWRDRAINRMRGLLKIVGDQDIVLAQENCSGYGGIRPDTNVELLQAIDDPRFGELFDTGNPPTYAQDSWKWYQQVVDRIVYVHIKDAKAEKVDGEDVYTFPGEGAGYVREIVTDLLHRGYDGGFSIEPHLAAVIHKGQKAPDPFKAYELYLEYGRRLMQIVEEVRSKA